MGTLARRLGLIEEAREAVLKVTAHMAQQRSIGLAFLGDAGLILERSR